MTSEVGITGSLSYPRYSISGKLRRASVPVALECIEKKISAPLLLLRLTIVDRPRSSAEVLVTRDISTS